METGPNTYMHAVKGRECTSGTKEARTEWWAETTKSSKPLIFFTFVFVFSFEDFAF
jgi:hypothetical protein